MFPKRFSTAIKRVFVGKRFFRGAIALPKWVIFHSGFRCPQPYVDYGGALFYPTLVCRPAPVREAPKGGLGGSAPDPPLPAQIRRTEIAPRKLQKKPDTRSPRVTTPLAPPLRPPPPPPLHPHCPNYLHRWSRSPGMGTSQGV